MDVLSLCWGASSPSVRTLDERKPCAHVHGHPSLWRKQLPHRPPTRCLTDFAILIVFFNVGIFSVKPTVSVECVATPRYLNAKPFPSIIDRASLRWLCFSLKSSLVIYFLTRRKVIMTLIILIVETSYCNFSVRKAILYFETNGNAEYLQDIPRNKEYKRN